VQRTIDRSWQHLGSEYNHNQRANWVGRAEKADELLGRAPFGSHASTLTRALSFDRSLNSTRGIVGRNTTVGTCSRKISEVLVATTLLTALFSTAWARARASQHRVEQQPTSSVPLVIQGRITEIQGSLVTVKTPDGYPGGPGVHPQFVTAGPSFRIDVSGARLLLPDGKQADKVPLTVGDHVVAVLTEPNSGSPLPGSGQTYSASIVERVIKGDKVATH